MAQELVLEVKSNIKSVTKETEDWANSLKEVNEQIEIQGSVITDLEKDLIKLKAKQDAIPKGAWVAGMDKLNDKIKKTSTELKLEKNALKDLKTQQGKATTEVKKFTDAQKEQAKSAKEGIGNFTVMGVSLNSVKAAFGKVIPMAKAMFGSIKAGIMSTGIGALILAVISLFSYFKKTQRGAEMLERAMAGVGAVVDVVVDLFSSVGETMVNAFKDPKKAIKELWEDIKKNLMNRLTGVIDGFKAAGKIIQAALKFDWDTVKEGALEYGQALIQVGTGLDVEQQKAFADSIKGVVNEMTEEAAAAMRLKDIMQNIRREEMEFSKVQAQTRQDVAKARLLAMDESKTQEERLEAINSVMDKELKMTADIIKMQKKKIAAKKEENRLGESMIEDKEALMALEVELIDLTTQSTMTQKRLMTEVEALNLEIIAKNKADAKKKADDEKATIKSEKLDVEAFSLWKLERLQDETDEALKIRMKAAEELKKAQDEEVALLLSLEQENSLALIENLQERALAELKIQEDKEVASVELMENAEEIKEQIRIKYARARGEIVKSTAKNEIAWENMTQEQKLNKVKNTAGEMSKILGEESAAGKAFAVTQATIDTFQGANAAYSSMAKIPYVGPVLGTIAAGAAIVAGLANVKAILSAGSGGAPPPATTPATTETQIPAPQMMSGAFELTGGQEVEPIQAYVVSDNITDSQNGLAIIRRRATI